MFLSSLVLIVTSILIAFLTFRLISRSIKEREKAEEALRESESKYRTIFESTGTAMVIFGENNIISLSNTEFEKLSGYSRDEIEGEKSWMEFIAKEDDIKKMKEYHREQMIDPDTAPKSYEFRFIGRKSNVRDIFITSSVIHGTKISVASLLDITDRKNMENALEKTNKSLQKAMDELKEIDKMKDEFFSSVTHEIRNPLTPVRLQSQLLLRSYFGELTEKQKNGVETILKNTNRIIRLTDDIMTISKMRAGVLKYEMTENDIVGIIENSVNNMEFPAKEKKIATIGKYPESFLVKCDKDRINQVIENLIGNAIKFTPENGKITVEAKRIKNDIIVSVEDTGIGISKENQEKLFSAFFQVSSKYGGTGLGLTICNSIIKDHHGKIWVESELGKGSKFSFSLPAIQK
ncbi:MAG: hypothetical protein A7316_03585 [Candidatus Altiarchaeales archaeon WOR_SM1_86-2]|nr:MAG: hypothetical protein A7316_03585 [Candidatus Altiarchaeales archaeon WOR_SM1_86-2]